MPVIPFIPAIVSTVGSVVGAKIAAGGNTSAAQTNAAAADKAAQLQYQSTEDALNQARDIYNQQVAAEQPSTRSGYASLNALNYGLGLPAQNIPPPVQPLQASTGSAVQPTSTLNGFTFPGSPQVPSSETTGLSTVANQGGTAGNLASQVLGKVNNAQNIVNQQYAGSGATTKVLAPNGVTYLVPNGELDAATKAGGTVVS